VGVAGWHRVGRTAALVAGACLAGQTALFMLDEMGLLADSPDYVETSAGRAADLATYYAAFFAYQQDILWNIALRDTLAPVAYLALMVLALSVANVLGPRRPVSQLIACSSWSVGSWRRCPTCCISPPLSTGDRRAGKRRRPRT
jgi:hypothetical protein